MRLDGRLGPIFEVRVPRFGGGVGTRARIDKTRVRRRCPTSCRWTVRHPRYSGNPAAVPQIQPCGPVYVMVLGPHHQRGSDIVAHADRPILGEPSMCWNTGSGLEFGSVAVIDILDQHVITQYQFQVGVPAVNPLDIIALAVGVKVEIRGEFSILDALVGVLPGQAPMLGIVLRREYYGLEEVIPGPELEACRRRGAEGCSPIPRARP